MPAQAPKISNKSRLRALWCGAIVYFFILLNELLHIREIPYITLAIVTLLNGAIFAALLLAIRRIYKERANPAESNLALPTSVIQLDRKRIRILWIAVGVYVSAFVFAVPFAARSPYHGLLIWGLGNMAIVSVFIVLLRREYIKPGKRDGV
jgi:hypothetical protein